MKRVFFVRSTAMDHTGALCTIKSAIARRTENARHGLFAENALLFFHLHRIVVVQYTRLSQVM